MIVGQAENYKNFYVKDSTLIFSTPLFLIFHKQCNDCLCGEIALTEIIVSVEKFQLVFALFQLDVYAAFCVNNNLQNRFFFQECFTNNKNLYTFF